MNKIALFGLTAAFVPLAAFAFAPTAPAGPGAIEDMMRGMFKAFDEGDHAAVKACIATSDARFPVLVWDNDLEGKPIAVSGSAEVGKYLDGLLDGIAKMKAKTSTKVSDLHADCDAPGIGYATCQLTQSVTVDGKTEAANYWVTALVTADKENKWHIFHWHSSAATPAATTK